MVKDKSSNRQLLVIMNAEDITEVDDKSWEETVEKNDLPVIVLFYSPDCIHSQDMIPCFIELATKFKRKIRFISINVINNPFTINRYGIVSTPTFKFFCGGRPFQELVGAVHPSTLEKLIEEATEHGNRCVEKSTLINYDVVYI